MQKKIFLTGSALAILFIAFTSASFAQTGELRRLSITPIPQPDEGIPVFRDHPDNAALILYSTLTNLSFESNMGGIVDQRSEPARGRYILIIEPFTQIMQINAPGYVTGRFRVAAPQAREVFYYEIEPEERMPDLIPVTFNVEPPDSRLYVDDQITETNRTVQLPPGVKQIRLEREGYRVVEDVITVSMDNVQFNYQMDEIDIVLVRVTSNVPGARVVIDGTERGQIDSAGGFGVFLYPGSYAISVDRSGYITQNKTLQVSEGRENRISMELIRNIGTLSLQISPSDAKVQLNRQDYSGRSYIELAPGRYRLEVERPGYEPHSETIEVNLNEQISKSIRLKAHTGALQFSVNPSNARIVLRDETGRVVRRWEGFNLLRELKVGTYSLTVEADGYMPWSSTIRVQTNDIASVNVELKRVVHGSLRVTTNTSNAQGTLYRNGVPVSRWQGNRTFNELSPDQYTISYKSSLHRDYHRTISLSSGEDKVVRARLVRLINTKDFYTGVAYHNDSYWGTVWGGFFDYLWYNNVLLSMDVRFSQKLIKKPLLEAIDTYCYHVNTRIGFRTNSERIVIIVPSVMGGFNWVRGDFAKELNYKEEGWNFGLGINFYSNRLMARLEYIWHWPPWLEYIWYDWPSRLEIKYDYGEKQSHVSLSFGIGF